MSQSPRACGPPHCSSRRRPRVGSSNTTEPSRELSAGDVVAVGEAALAVGRVGWSLVRGGLDEVRTGEHGNHPLPAPGPTPGGEAAAARH